MGSPRRSLTDYAEENPGHRLSRCAVCTWPEREDIDAGFRAGLRSTLIARWLVEDCGYDRTLASTGKLDYHFRSSHHAPTS